MHLFLSVMLWPLMLFKTLRHMSKHSMYLNTRNSCDQKEARSSHDNTFQSYFFFPIPGKLLQTTWFCEAA